MLRKEEKSMKKMTLEATKAANGGKRKVYVCRYCGSMFGQTSDLGWHAFWRHWGRKSYYVRYI